MSPSLLLKTIDLNLKEAAQFLRSVRSNDTCVYVASGPTAHRCNEFPDADLIGVNNTWKIMKQKPAAMLTQCSRYIDAMDPKFVPWVLCPTQVWGTGHYIDAFGCDFPKEQMRTFEILEERFLDTGKMIQKLNTKQLPVMLRFGSLGTYGLIFCALAGYRKIVCCGHDGGVGRHPLLSTSIKTKEHNVNLKRTRELALALVQHKHCPEIVFVQDLNV